MKFKLTLSAWRDILDKYRVKWNYSWSHRKELERPDRTSEEAEFLPSALSIQDTPVGPMTSWVARIIATFAVLAILASLIFELDVVVSVQGSVIPSGHVKAVQTLEAAVVRRIAISEGQRVQQGDVLVELFAPGVDTDAARLQAEHDAASAELVRLRAMLKMIDGHGGLTKDNKTELDSSLLGSRFQEYASKKARAEAEVAKRSAELISATETLKKTSESIPRLELKSADYKALEAQGYVSRHSMIDQQQLLLEAHSDVQILQSKISESRAMLNQAKQELSGLLAEIRRTALEQQRDYEIKLSTSEQEVAKYKKRDQLMVLRAPINGKVAHLMAYTVGGVIPAAQTLMSIVPENRALEIEAVVENKDIGFIKNGQLAQIKIESYPFAKYGLLYGKVVDISANAVNDEKKGLIYKSRIELPNEDERRRSFPYELVAGMNATGEIKIGKRKVIEYFLSPFLTTLKETAHER